MSIEVRDLSYVYSPGTPYAATALDHVDLTVDEGDFVGIIGKTGSGKSTFIQHLNALIRLQSGSIKVYDIDLTEKKPDLKRLRGTVGMVMQYPEYQLFDETVEKDVSYGPKIWGFPKRRSRDALGRRSSSSGSLSTRCGTAPPSSCPADRRGVWRSRV